MDEKLIESEMAKYEWYHIIKVTENLSTPGHTQLLNIQEVPLRALRTIELEKKRVLDIGCRDGLFCFEAEKLGAEEVIGIDNDLSKGAVNFLIPVLNSKVKMYERNVLDLKPETFGLFDLVIFPGVLYHLRYPFWSLKLISDLITEGGILLLETAIYMDNNQQSILFCPTGEESPFEATSCTFFNIKGLINTLFTLGLIVEDIELMCHSDILADIMFNIEMKQENPLTINVPADQLDRATLICRKQSETENPKVLEYWNSTHKVHTNNQL